MPDRYGERDDDDPPIEADAEVRRHLTGVPSRRLSAQEREEARQRRISCQLASSGLRAAGIARCLLCDDDGYTRNGMVCDHVDRRGTYSRGRELVRAAMGWAASPAAATTPVRVPQRDSPGRNGRSAPNPPRTGCGTALGDARDGDR